MHDLALVGFRSSLIDNSYRCSERLCHISGSRYASVVRRNDNYIFQILIRKIFGQDRHTHQMIDRDIKIALYLRGMKIHRKNSVRPSGHQEIRNQLGCDRISGLGLPVLSGIAIIRYYSIYPACVRPFHSIYHYQQLHQVIIDRVTGRLHYVTVRTSDCLPQIHRNLSVTELVHSRPSERLPHYGRYLLRQLRMGISRKYLVV